MAAMVSGSEQVHGLKKVLPLRTVMQKTVGSGGTVLKLLNL